MENEQLKSIIETLDPVDRSIMYYRFVSVRTFKGIGRMYNLSTTQVRYRLNKVCRSLWEGQYKEEDICECLREYGPAKCPKLDKNNDLGCLINHHESAFRLCTVTNNPFKLAVRLSGLNKWFNKNKRNISLDSSDIESAIVLLNHAFDNEDLESLNKGIHILLSNGTDHVYSLRDLFNERNIDCLLPASYHGVDYNREYQISYSHVDELRYNTGCTIRSILSVCPDFVLYTEKLR